MQAFEGDRTLEISVTATFLSNAAFYVQFLSKVQDTSKGRILPFVLKLLYYSLCLSQFFFELPEICYIDL
jgi:hypothetical protein